MELIKEIGKHYNESKFNRNKKERSRNLNNTKIPFVNISGVKMQEHTRTGVAVRVHIEWVSKE